MKMIGKFPAETCSRELKNLESWYRRDDAAAFVQECGDFALLENEWKVCLQSTSTTQLPVEARFGFVVTYMIHEIIGGLPKQGPPYSLNPFCMFGEPKRPKARNHNWFFKYLC
jgi:hypothetical protein